MLGETVSSNKSVEGKSSMVAVVKPGLCEKLGFYLKPETLVSSKENNFPTNESSMESRGNNLERVDSL